MGHKPDESKRSVKPAKTQNPSSRAGPKAKKTEVTLAAHGLELTLLRQRVAELELSRHEHTAAWMMLSDRISKLELAYPIAIQAPPPNPLGMTIIGPMSGVTFERIPTGIGPGVTLTADPTPVFTTLTAERGLPAGSLMATAVVIDGNGYKTPGKSFSNVEGETAQHFNNRVAAEEAKNNPS